MCIVEREGSTLIKKDYRVVDEKVLFSGAVFDIVERDIEVVTPNDEGLGEVNHITRQIVTYGDSVLIVPITKDGKHMLLGEEYRTVVNGTQIGFPAGRIDDTDEQYVDAVHRELREELGVLALEGVQPIHLFSAHASLGYTLEKIHAYLVVVDDENMVDTEFDSDEYVELRRFTIDEVGELIRNGILTSMSAQLAYEKAISELGKSSTI